VTFSGMGIVLGGQWDTREGSPPRKRAGSKQKKKRLLRQRGRAMGGNAHSSLRTVRNNNWKKQFRKGGEDTIDQE